MDKKIIAVILAGGRGERAGGKIPKQFMEIASKPMIVHAVERFSRTKYINGIIVVSMKEYIGRVGKLVQKYKIKKVIDIVPAGITRQDSSYNGVAACPRDSDIVLIHDAARPFTEEKIIKRVINAAVKYGSAVPVIDVSDTIAFEEKGNVKNIPERGGMKSVQTPQGFHYKVIHEAHRRAKEDGVTSATDDCSLVMRIGEQVKMVEGRSMNAKITNKCDMEKANAVMQGIQGKERA